MPLAVKLVAVFAAVNVLIIVFLGQYVTRMRRRTKTILLDGGKPEMIRAVRAHGNASEYIPLGLLVLLLVHYLGGDAVWILVIGLPFTLGRLVHPYGILASSLRTRIAGMILTIIPLVIGAFWLLWRALTA